MLTNISRAQIKFHPHSFADPDGRVFWFDGKLYRAISVEKATLFERLFQDGTIPELISCGMLPGSEPTGLVIDGYGMVLRHTPVSFVSYPHEWCAAMFRDAALAYLDLLRELLKRELTLQDTHPWNLLFEGSRPVFVDITAIASLKDRSRTPDYDKFCSYYLYPLILMSQRRERIVRCLLQDGLTRPDGRPAGILPSDFLLMTRGSDSGQRLTRRVKSYLRRRCALQYRKVLRRAASFTRFGDQTKTISLSARLEGLARIRREIEAVALPLAAEEPCNRNWEFQKTLLQVISQLEPVSILGLGTRIVSYSALAGHSGAKVVAIDKDSTRIMKLYRTAREKNLQLLPLVMDVADPTPSRGFSSHVSISATDRLQCDLVLAIGLLNYMTVERHLRFDQVAEGLAQFSKRWLIIDCESPGPKAPASASEDLIEALLKRFRNVRRLQLHAEAHNFLLCEK